MGNDFNSLEIYRLAEELIVKIYQLTAKFPKEEMFGITSQLRRAALSVALNIAEAYGRFSYKEKVVFLYNSRGSLLESKSVLQISLKLGFASAEEIRDLVTGIDKLGVKINNYIGYLKKINKK